MQYQVNLIDRTQETAKKTHSLLSDSFKRGNLATLEDQARYIGLANPADCLVL